MTLSLIQCNSRRGWADSMDLHGATYFSFCSCCTTTAVRLQCEVFGFNFVIVGRTSAVALMTREAVVICRCSWEDGLHILFMLYVGETHTHTATVFTHQLGDLISTFTQMFSHMWHTPHSWHISPLPGGRKQSGCLSAYVVEPSDTELSKNNRGGRTGSRYPRAKPV